MPRLAWIMTGAMLLVLCGCQSAVAPSTLAVLPPKPSPAPLPEGVAESMQPAIAFLASAEVVESDRINPKRAKDLSQGVLGYPVISHGPRLSADQARRLAELIADPRGYCGTHWCGAIEPGIAFRFKNGSHTLTVLVCFKCQEWEFWRDGERVGGDSFDGLQPELLRLVQAVFPEDQALAGIQPKELFERIYRIDDVAGGPTAKSLDESEANIRSAIGDPEGWRENGGTRLSLRRTADGKGFILMSSAAGHAAAARVKGIVPWDRR